MLDGLYHVSCECCSQEHSLQFILDKDESYPCIYLHYFLTKEVWYTRIWLGIKYIFGYKCKYGHFGETILVQKQVDQIKELIEEWENK